MVELKTEVIVKHERRVCIVGIARQYGRSIDDLHHPEGKERNQGRYNSQICLQAL